MILRGNKFWKCLYIVLIMIALIIPAISINTEKNVQSMMDNRVLKEFPERDSINPKTVEAYINDRIGFREEMITASQYADLTLFNELNHPLFMLGKNGWIYTREWDSIDYQHLDEDTEYINNITKFLNNAQEYCHENGMGFCFFLSPNKESIYPEMYPDGYNIANQDNRSDRIIEGLNNLGVDYIDARIPLLEKKDTILVCNKKNDAGHWNDAGAYLGMERLYSDYIFPNYPDVGMLDLAEFHIGTRRDKYLMNSYIIINEDVPWYTLIDTKVIDTSEQLAENHEVITYGFQFKNSSANSGRKILIFGYSYLDNFEANKYFTNHFSEVTMLHIANMHNLFDYVEELDPDILIIEAAERVFKKNDPLYDWRFQWKSEWFEKMFPAAEEMSTGS